jgi:hypothetical protein
VALLACIRKGERKTGGRGGQEGAAGGEIKLDEARGIGYAATATTISRPSITCRRTWERRKGKTRGRRRRRKRRRAAGNKMQTRPLASKSRRPSLTREGEKRTGIKKEYSLALEHFGGSGRHAVDAPLRVAVHVADGDGEAAVVGANHLDGLVAAALDEQLVALASVGRAILGTVRRLT